MIARRRAAVIVAGLAGSACVLLFGCGESDSSIEAVEYRPMSFQTGASVEIHAIVTNGGVTIRGEQGRTTTEVTAILRANGRSLEQAQQRVEGLQVTMSFQEGRLWLAFEPPDEAANWNEKPSVRFEIRTPAQVLIDVATRNGDALIDAIDGGGAIEASQGEIQLGRSTGNFELRATNGAIRADAVVGALLARGVRSDIAVTESKIVADLETDIGKIEFSGRLVGPEHRIHASNGGITLEIPADSELRLEASVHNGLIDSDLPLAGDTEGGTWSATLNAPTALLTLRAVNGRIYINALGNI